MPSILFLLFIVFLCNSLPTPLQCDSTVHEYERASNLLQLCLVLNECVVGDTQPRQFIVEFNSRTQQLKDEKCEVFIRMRLVFKTNLNDLQWFVEVTTDNTINNFLLKQDGLGVFNLKSLIFRSSAITNMNGLGVFNLKSLIFRSSAITNMSGCNDSLINVQSAIVSEGKALNVPTRLVGRNAAIDCNEKRADRLYIKRSTDADFVEVTKVFCPETVWAVEQSDGKIEYLGEETFDLKCIRNYCKYCGRIAEQSCDSCEDIEYEDCMPKCPRNLWVRSGIIINSIIKCEGNEESKGDFGEWTLRSNGVNVPFLAGSCYTGPYPLHEKHKAISNFSPSFSHRAIPLVLLAAFNWIGIC
ncbi:hypothetical protein PRIPAC_89602 [Pristionchus pacificus]|uniref:Uncharacterized protein n=1 Tax=Pristionchus pacificus TaxID=54126 RepID=A0A2A6CXJ8_PRIPA|nr:hypothetical protein PRIPAC_89602 [Pristionchus pacificus]|eukprot:PDM82858.1 hypothetical protein PRIPAC_37251 [Pristionchus pacificus]